MIAQLALLPLSLLSAMVMHVHAPAHNNMPRLAATAGTMLLAGVELASDEGHFRVVLPSGFSNPVASTLPISTARGTLDMQVYTSAKGTNAVFLIGYIDYPDQAFEQSTTTMLDGARDGALRNLNAKLSSQKDVKLMGYPGRTITFAGTSEGQKLYGRVDYYIVKPRLFQVLYLSSKKKDVADKNIKDAFASFAFTDTPAAE